MYTVLHALLSAHRTEDHKGYERTYFEQVGCRMGMTLGAGITALIRQSVVCAVRMNVLRAGCRLGMILHAGITPLTRQSVVCAVRMNVLRAGYTLGMILHAGITPLTGTVCGLCLQWSLSCQHFSKHWT